MDDHTAEKHWVKPREGAVKAGDQGPSKRKVQVGGVLDLASVLVPAIAKKGVTGRSGDLLRVLDRLPWQLRKGLAVHLVAAFLAAEHGLLAVASVPDPVGEEVGGVEKDEHGNAVAVLRWMVIGEVDGAMAVAKRNTSQVPEDEHEAPFFVVHVPVHTIRDG